MAVCGSVNAPVHSLCRGQPSAGSAISQRPAPVLFQANRAPDKQYRTSPLKGLWTHQTRGFYHDGRFPTLLDVVNHYNTQFGLGLTAQEKADLIQYLKSL